MAKVERKSEHEHFDKLLNRFKKAVDNDNVLRIVQENTYYTKPTTKRKKAKALAVKRQQKQLRDEALAIKILRQGDKR